MTAQLLTSQLNNLIQESKRKNAELRNAAENAVGELKGLPNTSESQLAGDLSRRPKFVKPFVLACKSSSGKTVGSGIICLQRLAVSQGLSRDTLKDVLEALDEATSQNADVQLKILQTLTAVVQNYGVEIRGDLIVKALWICSNLQASKTAVVSSTAAATLQQLVVAMFDKVAAEDASNTEAELLHPGAAAQDAHKIMTDICLLAEGTRPELLRVKSVTPNFSLELMEAVLSRHWLLFLSHPEENELLRSHVLPMVVKLLSNRTTFPSTVRATRLLLIILRHHLSIPAIVRFCGGALEALNRMLEPDPAYAWRRALSMEVWRAIYAEPGLVGQLYARYDQGEDKPIMRDQTAAMARLAGERPDIIGLGQQSRAPTANLASRDRSTEQAAMEAGGLAGMIGGVVSSQETEIQGISVQWSSIRTPCIDQLDKSESPTLPDSYIYSLVLSCISGFADGTAKVVIPLTIPTNVKNRKKARATVAVEDDRSSALAEEQTGTSSDTSTSGNPSSSAPHISNDIITTAAEMIEECWPAILATCSTFLSATLDHNYFHGLVRCFQKLTHVAGLLRLTTPRDAFLTTLSKSAVPSHKSFSTPMSTPVAQAFDNQDTKLKGKDDLRSNGHTRQASIISFDDLREPTHHPSEPSLNTRNLLCLRALLNLGIALGPILGDAWRIVLETWHRADFIINTLPKGMRGQSTEIHQGLESLSMSHQSSSTSEVDSEIMAVGAAASRMLESTIEFTDEAFNDILHALAKLLYSAVGPLIPAGDDQSSPPVSPRSSPSEPGPRVRGLYIIHPATALQTHAAQFYLGAMGTLAKVNTTRLLGDEPVVSGWNALTQQLIDLSCSSSVTPLLRLKAAELMNRLVRESSVTDNDPVARSAVLQRCLSALHTQVGILTAGAGEASSDRVDISIHQTILDSLKMILEIHGEALLVGWDMVFEIIKSVFGPANASHVRSTENLKKSVPSSRSAYTARSAKLLRAAFASLQLICSDFLSSLPSPCILVLIETLFAFCSQDEDLNISLTTLTFFWSVSSYVQSREDKPSGMDSQDPIGIDEIAILEQVETASGSNTNLSLWMLLLLRLTRLTIDGRPDIRNGAIQSIFRILEAYGDQLSADSWHSCLDGVIFRVVEQDVERAQRLEPSRKGKTDRDAKALDETTIIILKGISELFATYSQILLRHHDSRSAWPRLLQCFESTLARRRPGLSVTTYECLRHLLLKVTSPALIGIPSLDLIWTMWLNSCPAKDPAGAKWTAENTEVLLAYVRCLKELYRLSKDHITEQRAVDVLDSLFKCVLAADRSNHRSHDGKLTVLQTEAFEVVHWLRVEIPGISSILINWLATFVTLPLEHRSSKPVTAPARFITMATTSITIMESIVMDNINDKKFYNSSAFRFALRALARIIDVQDQLEAEITRPLLRAAAINSGLAVLASAIPNVKELDIADSEEQPIWSCVVKIASGILEAGGARACSAADLPSQVQSDLTAFLTLRGLVTPALGFSSISKDTLRAYIESLFSNSLIHEPEPEEMPGPTKEILEDLYEIRMGRTYDPPASKRNQIGYACLDELFSLVARHDGSPQRVRLAQAASPFLIGRVAITLRGYIADQPLRGRMPQPRSQRRELLYLLHKLLELRCEPSAIPNAPGAVSEDRRHLYRLLPLISHAIEVAWRDQELLIEFGRFVSVVSQEMGVV